MKLIDIFNDAMKESIFLDIDELTYDRLPLSDFANELCEGFNQLFFQDYAFFDVNKTIEMIFQSNADDYTAFKKIFNNVITRKTKEGLESIKKIYNAYKNTAYFVGGDTTKFSETYEDHGDNEKSLSGSETTVDTNNRSGGETTEAYTSELGKNGSTTSEYQAAYGQFTDGQSSDGLQLVKKTLTDDNTYEHKEYTNLTDKRNVKYERNLGDHDFIDEHGKRESSSTKTTGGSYHQFVEGYESAKKINIYHELCELIKPYILANFQ